MPTIKNISGPYRFFFYSFDCNEPVHCTFSVRTESASTGFCLLPWLETTVFLREN
jgi:hypothetical protein